MNGKVSLTQREVYWAIALGLSVALQGALIGWSLVVIVSMVCVPTGYLFIKSGGVRMAAVAIGLGGAGMALGAAVDLWIEVGTFAVCECEGGHALWSASTGLMLLGCGLGCRYACPECSGKASIHHFGACVIHGLMLVGMYAALLFPKVIERIGVHGGMVLGMAVGTVVGWMVLSWKMAPLIRRMGRFQFR